MTDSPLGAYKNVDDYGLGLISYTTAITSIAFNLQDCPNPVLTFRHDYVLAQLGAGQDWGRVDLSTDDGAVCHSPPEYFGQSGEGDIDLVEAISAPDRELYRF